MYISLFTVAIPVNYITEFRELLDATTYVYLFMFLALHVLVSRPRPSSSIQNRTRRLRNMVMFLSADGEAPAQFGLLERGNRND